MTGRGLSGIVAGIAIYLAVAGGDTVGGYPTREAVALLLLASGLLGLTAWAVERARPDWRAAAGAVAMWAVFVTTLAWIYVEREAVLDGARSAAEEIGVARPVTIVTGSGEVTVTRRGRGGFVLPARVNGQDTHMVFDTGASTVVLTAETAAVLGFRPEALRFRVPVMTANGRALAAPVMLERVAIGGITLPRVQALVSAPGALHENLLGQSFLERLGSYEVRGNRLILRAAEG